MMSHQPRLISPTYYPLLGATSGILTILTCYHLTRTSHHFPPDVTTPPISLLGCRPPERRVYQIGFSITGLLLLRCILVEYTRLIHPFWKKIYPVGASIAYVGAIMAAVGCVGQGIMTLEEEFVRKATLGLRPGEVLEATSMWHQILALVFFLGAAMHCYTMVYMFSFGKNERTKEEEEEKKIPKNEGFEKGRHDAYNKGNHQAATKLIIPIYSKKSCILKIICAASTFISWPIAELLHPLTSNGQGVDTRNIDLGGLAQYVAVGAYILFFGSYSLDLKNIELERGWRCLYREKDV